MHEKPITNREQDYRCLCASLRKASRSVTTVFDNALRPSGLRATQFHILAEIRGAGATTVSKLTSRLAMDQTTVTRSLALLINANLLTEAKAEDARVKLVRLTPKGSRALESAQPLWARAQQQMKDLMGEQSWSALNKKLDTLTGKLR